MAKIKPVQRGGYDPTTGLPTPETVQSIIPTEQPTTEPTAKQKKTFTLKDAITPPPPRAAGRTRQGRIKFTTMIHPDLRMKLENMAAHKGISIADVLEIVLNEYLGKK